MSQLAGILVLVGAATLFLAGEVIDDLFLGGIFLRRFRPKARSWMRWGLLALVVGALLVVAGIAMLHSSQ